MATSPRSESEEHDDALAESEEILADDAAKHVQEVISSTSVVIHTAPDSEARAALFNEGYETAMAQQHADDPGAADEWLAKHDQKVRAEALADFGFLWDYQINRGLSFIIGSIVPTARKLLAGIPLEEIKGFEWVAQARKDSEE